MRVPLKAAAAAAGTPMSLLLLLLLLLQGAVGVRILGCLNSLDSTHYLQAGNYTLVVQEDCNLVLYEGNYTIVWETGTGGKGVGCRAQLQSTGDLDLYNASTAGQGSPIWESDGRNENGNFLMLDATGKLSIKLLADTEDDLYSQLPSEGVPGPGFKTVPNQDWETVSSVLYMVAGYQLSESSTLNNGPYSLGLNSSCFLELSYKDSVLWSSGYSRLPPGEACRAVVLQENGNLTIVGSAGGVAWTTNVGGPPSVDSYVLHLSDKGNVSIFNSLQLEEAIWTTELAENNPGSQVWVFVGVFVAVVILSVAVGALAVWRLALYYGCCLGVFSPAGKDLSIELMKEGGRCLSLSPAMIWQATNGYEKMLGEGGFGKVYYGKLADGRQVAVKKLSPLSSQGKDEFYNEIKLLSVVHHQYLVSLVGYCLSGKSKILVYEYMSGGDLHQRLHADTAVSQPLSWNERTRIVMQVAEGLEYLHHGCRPAIFHRDVKSNNILLDDKMCAKVADFGLSKLVAVEPEATHVSTAVKGTFGYLDPEYYQSRKLTEKSDVYAFGILLMETLTARHPTNPQADRQDKVFIGQWVKQAWKAGQILELCDPNLGDAYNDQQFTELVRLSLWCVKASGQARPSMAQVVQQLRDLGLVQLGPLRSIKGRPFHDSHDYSVEDIESGGLQTGGTDASASETEWINSRSGSLGSSTQMAIL